VTPVEALVMARGHGLAVRVIDGSRLAVRGDKPVPRAVLDALRDHRTELIRMLALERVVPASGDVVPAPVVEVGLSSFPTPEYVVVQSAGELIEHWPRLLGQRWLGLDTETSGLDVVSDKVCLVQLAPADGSPVVIVDTRAVDPQALAPLVESEAGPVLVGHNRAFDLSMLYQASDGVLVCPSSRRLFDTELLERLLGASWAPAPRGTYSLQQVVQRYFNQHLPKEQQLSDFSARELNRDQLDYAARDAAAVLALAMPLRDAVVMAGMREVAKIEMACLPFMVWLSVSGAPLDVGRWTALADGAQTEQTRLELELTELAGTGGLMGAAGDFRFSTVNWGAPAQVLKLLQARGLDPRDGLGKPSTEADVLASLAEDDQIIDVLLRYRDANTRVDRYGMTWLAEWLRGDGRVHPDYHQLGTSVGRMSVSDPMIQGVPRGPRYRSAFRPLEGRVWIKGDYSQIDLRVIAEHAPDETLIRAYQRGEDVHRLTGGRVRGIDPAAVNAEDRQAAKAANFGLSYGMGSARFIAQARSEYGVTFTRAEAQEFRNGFFGLYRGIKAWHDRIREPYGEETPIDICVPSGRRRLGVKRFTEKLPSPIQMQVSDGFKRGLAELWRTRAQVGGDPKLAVVAHDEVGIEVDCDQAIEAAEWLRVGMTAGMQTILSQVPVVFETTIGQDWAGTPL
jgi:DNA polymerase I-like protein with 3'-5' exonuclease and polymerase domains